jgi:hypothetical protein
VPIVNPEWIVASLRAGHLLPVSMACLTACIWLFKSFCLPPLLLARSAMHKHAVHLMYIYLSSCVLWNCPSTICVLSTMLSAVSYVLCAAICNMQTVYTDQGLPAAAHEGPSRSAMHQLRLLALFICPFICLGYFSSCRPRISCCSL